MASISAELVLEEDCGCMFRWPPVLNTKGKYVRDHENYAQKSMPDCYMCGGTGTRPSDLGRQLLDFVNKYK